MMKADISNADEFDEAELRLRQDIEEAIENAADWMNDATLWWDDDDRLIDAVIAKIVLAAKDYSTKAQQRCRKCRGEGSYAKASGGFIDCSACDGRGF